MSGKQITTYLGSAAVALALGALVASSAALAGGGDRTRCEAPLTCHIGGADCSGKAKGESETKNDELIDELRVKLNVSVEFRKADFDAGEKVVLAAGNMLEVDIEGVYAGSITLDPGAVDLEGVLDLDNTEGDDPPVVSSGDDVEVFGPGGTLVLYGKFQTDGSDCPALTLN